MPIAREGTPFVLVPLLAALAAAATGWIWPAAACALLALAAALFFRDPERAIPEDSDLLVSPADGRVISVTRENDGWRIAIFLSVFDVHINRAPLAGRVTWTRHRRGRFLAAFRPEAATANERRDTRFDTAVGTVEVAQIAGLIARRIVCRVSEGQTVAKGERIGLIRFGSRTDLVLPAGVEPLVEAGDRVRGGSSAIARVAGSPEAPR